MKITANDVLTFWFHDIDPKLRFQKNLQFDEQIRERFLPTYQDVAAGKTAAWRETPEGRLAEVIVLDQFPRNMFRGTERSFESDELALARAQDAVKTGADQKLEIKQRGFLYMPYMHSESKAVHEEVVKLFSQPGLENSLDFELRHKAIIDRFGRYPHRNEILGRTSTLAEIEFLKTPGSSF